MIYVLLFLIGVAAGHRAGIPLAALAIGAWAGWIDLSGSWLAFLGYAWTPWILTVLALGELVTDQLPSTPSRKVPMQFGARIVMGAVCGAAIGIAGGNWVLGLVAGAVGAVVGTLGGYEARKRLVAATGGRDLPIALLEDAVAIVGAWLIVASV